MAKDSRGSNRRVVPVSSRNAAGATRRKPSGPKLKLGALEIAVLVTVAIIILVTIAAPLRNYFQQRTEIARVTESIAAKEQERDALREEIERYGSDAYVAEQARQRLGVIAEGETAYRIIDPAMDRDSSVTTAEQEVAESRTWYEILWTSISEPEVLEPAPESEEEREERHRMPIDPDTLNPEGEQSPGEPVPAPEAPLQ